MIYTVEWSAILLPQTSIDSVGNPSNMTSMLPGRSLFASVPLLLLSAVALHAQTHKVDTPERVTRAIGVYEWTGDLAKPTAARLVPVSLFVDKHFEDAGVYLARPVPFVLQTGDVYSVERAGEPIGTLDLASARNIVTRHAAADDDPVGAWYGYGSFITREQEAKLAAAKAARNAKMALNRPGIVLGSLDEDSDDKPHFVRRDSSTASTGTAADKGSGSGSADSTPDVDDDPDRPTLRRHDPDEDTKTEKKKKSKEGGFVTPPNTSLNDDPDRPTLHRGVPAGQVVAAQLSGMPPDLHQAVAVSDAKNLDDHLFDREWDSNQERSQTLAALEALALPRIAAYIAANKLSPVSPKPTLVNEQLNGYTLSYGGLPTFVYTVESPVASGGPVYLTLVTQRLPTGELQVSLISITDASHLDRVPWMRPIDAVDADWSHRASLLFELRAQTSRQFALYRLVSAQAEPVFVTGVIE
jgi:hypothetical protein